jgi:hypothetical protein
MPVWQWIAIAAFVVIVVAVVIVAASVVRSSRQTGRLKQHYGHEYERLVSATGDSKAAEKELAARERKHDQLDIVPLTPSAFLEFSIRWQQVQTGFVDDPASAVGVADRLVNEVMRERGYAVDDFDQRAAGISVDHPQIVEDYRVAHGVHLSQQQGDVSTEQQREAFMHYRTLFEALLGTTTRKDASQEARA